MSLVAKVVSLGTMFGGVSKDPTRVGKGVGAWGGFRERRNVATFVEVAFRKYASISNGMKQNYSEERDSRNWSAIG